MALAASLAGQPIWNYQPGKHSCYPVPLDTIVGLKMLRLIMLYDKNANAKKK